MERAVEMVFADGEALEYSVVGKGEPVLVMHGGHSSCHEEFGFINLIKHGYKIITPSREGYGRTSKAIGKDLSTACRHYLKLLDHLKQKKIQLLAVSAKGTSGIFLASHYQDGSNRSPCIVP